MAFKVFEVKSTKDLEDALNRYEADLDRAQMKVTNVTISNVTYERKLLCIVHYEPKYQTSQEIKQLIEKYSSLR